MAYQGENLTAFENAITTLSESAVNLFSEILVQNGNAVYSGVKPEFPRVLTATLLEAAITQVIIKREKGIIERTVNLVKACEVLKGIEENLIREEASNPERTGLDAYDIVKPYVDILKQRLDIEEHFKRVQELFKQVEDNELSMEVHSSFLKFVSAQEAEEKDIYKEEILAASTSYVDAKRAHKQAEKEFYVMSKHLAHLENKEFNKFFSPHVFINAILFDKGDYYKTQEKPWNMMFTQMHGSPSEQASQVDNVQVQVNQGQAQAQDNDGRKAQIVLEAKMNQLGQETNDIMSRLNDVRLEEAKTSRSFLQNQIGRILDLKAEPGVVVENDLPLREAKILVRKLDQKIEDLQEAKRKKEELCKQEVQANLRALSTVKLAELNGFHDYLPWRTSQKNLNTHVDPFKKASLLQSTLKNKDDIERCKGIYDYTELMNILEQKYAHQDKLVPAMLKRVRELPEPKTNDPREEEVMLKNIGTILNVYSQLQSLGTKALSKFDSTVVEDLVLKLTSRSQEKYEEYIELKSGEVSDNEGVADNMSIGGADNLSVRNENPEDSKTKRLLFISFIKKQERILSNISARKVNLSSDSSDKQKPSAPFKPFCKKCKSKYCKCKTKANVNTVSAVTETGGGTPNADEYKCPTCSTTKPHLNRRGKPTKQLGACPSFRAMDLEKRKEIVKNHKRCIMCLGVNHTVNECLWKGGCIKKNCTVRHNAWLCGLPFPDKPVESKSMNNRGNINYAAVSGGKIIDERGSRANTLIFYDNGSTDNFILDSVAERHGYVGRKVVLNVQRLGMDYQPVQTKVYNIRLVNNKGNIVEITAHGIRHIGDHKRINDIPELARKFKVKPSMISNYYGPMEILLGRCNYGLHPKEISKSQNLGLLASQFGKPFMVVGSAKGNRFSSNESHVNVKHVECNFLNVKEKFWQSDALGLNPEPLCATCLKQPACRSCKLLQLPVSFKEAQEGQQIKNSMEFDYEKQEIRVSYPYIRNVREIFPPDKSNYPLAKRMATNLKKGLERDQILGEYCDGWREMISKGVIRELSDDEMKEWEAGENPINYCSHHAVIKEHKSTKIRVVCNSSLSHNGTSLNAELPKGPMALSNLLHVMLRFRSKPYAVIGDIAKAYWTLKTSKTDMHLRRFLWYHKEDLDKDDPPLRTFGMCRMTFGDRPAQYYLELAKQEVANYAERVMNDKEFANTIMASSYVDDVCPSFETKEEAETFREMLPKAFSVLGFKFKEIMIAGPNLKAPTADLQTLFGHMYDLCEDKIELKFVANFSSTKRGQKTGPDLTSKSNLSDLVLTKRNMGSLLGSQYDPLGLATPFIAKFKLFQSYIFKKYDWDTPLCPEDQVKARGLVRELLEASDMRLSFPRSTKPEGSHLHKLVAFSDGSSVAFATVLYGVYHDKVGNVASSLLTSKMRIASETVPRNELCGLVAAHRIVKNYLKCIDEKELEEINFVVDSTCILDYLAETNATKDIYVINRISEIRKEINNLVGNQIKVKYFWIHSAGNIADVATRDNCKFEYLFSDEWQNGPEWIKTDLEMSKAELKHTFEKEMVVNHEPQIHQVESCAIDCTPVKECPWVKLMNSTNNLLKVLRVWCIVKKVVQGKARKVGITNEDLQEAFLFFIKISQAAKPIKDLKVKQLVTFEAEGITYTRLRFTDESMELLFKKDKLPVLSSKTRFGKLLLLHAHANDGFKSFHPIHNTIHQTLVNSRVGQFGTYLTHARQSIKSLISSCVICRRLTKKIQEAQMGPKKGGFGTVPTDGSAFNMLALDYFGPFFAKAPKQRETRKAKPYKIYGLAILCLQTRGIRIYPVEGYDTESFLTIFKTHIANHGVPQSIISDPMRAFLAASKTLDDESQVDVDKNDMEMENIVSSRFGVKWNLIPPGTQWRDPAERAIKSIKNMMKTVFNTDKDMPILTIGEYNCLFAEIAEILNRRPIEGVMYEDTLRFICPNDIIIGRTSKEAPLEINVEISNKARLNLINQIKQNFWKQYLNILASDTRLFKYPCWYKHGRTPQVGDVVLVLYKSRVGESYRIGRIEEVDSTLRNLTLTVSPHQTGSPISFKSTAIMKVPVQRTILLYSPHDNIKEHEHNAESNSDEHTPLKISIQNESPEISDLKRKRGRPRSQPTNSQ